MTARSQALRLDLAALLVSGDMTVLQVARTKAFAQPGSRSLAFRQPSARAAQPASSLPARAGWHERGRRMRYHQGMARSTKSEKRLQVYSVLKLRERGLGQRNAMKMLQDAGLTVRAASSVLDRTMRSRSSVTSRSSDEQATSCAVSRSPELRLIRPALPYQCFRASPWSSTTRRR